MPLVRTAALFSAAAVISLWSIYASYPPTGLTTMRPVIPG